MRRHSKTRVRLAALAMMLAFTATCGIEFGTEPPVELLPRFERPMPIARDAEVVFLDPGRAVEGAVVQSVSVEGGVATVTWAAEQAVALEVVPRFFDGAGREVLAPLQPVSLGFEGEHQTRWSLPHRSAVDVAVSVATGRGEPPSEVPVLAHVTVTPAEFAALEFVTDDALVALGVGRPCDRAPKTMGWYERETGALRYGVQFSIAGEGEVPIRSAGLQHLSYDEGNAYDLVLATTADDVLYGPGVAAPVRALTHGGVELGVLASASAVFLGARLDGEGPRPEVLEGFAAGGLLTPEGWVERAGDLPLRTDPGLLEDPWAVGAGPSIVMQRDDGGIWLQEKPADPVAGDKPLGELGGTLYPKNGDDDGNCKPGETPVFAAHPCVVAWIVVGGSGGHATLGKGAKFPDATSPLGTPTQKAADAIADGVKGANDILRQCGVETQLHLCAVHVLDASKTEDPGNSNQTLDKGLFNAAGVTPGVEGEIKPGDPDPMGKLYDTITMLEPFKAEVGKHATCGNLFFVADVIDAQTRGLGGRTGPKRKSRPGGIVEDPARSSTIAHEMLHGFGHGGHADGTDADEQPLKKIQEEAAARRQAKKDAEAAAKAKRAEEAAKAKAADDAARDAADERRARRRAEAERDAEKHRQCDGHMDVRRRKKTYEDNKAAAEAEANPKKKAKLERDLPRWRGLYERALERCWKARLKHNNQNGRDARAAEAALKAAEAAAKKAQDDADDARKAADDATKARKAAEKAAEDAAEKAANLMDASPEGTALTTAQCKLIEQSIADNGLTCSCD